MDEIQYLVEKGGVREYVPQSEVQARVKDLWSVIGHRKVRPAPAAKVEAKAVAAETPAEGKKK